MTWIKISYNGLQRLAMVTYGYLDLSLDSILLVTILIVLGSTMDDQKLFSTQIANLLLVSIAIPAMLTSIDIAYNRPLVVVGSDTWIRSGKSEYMDREAKEKWYNFLNISDRRMSDIA